MFFKMIKECYCELQGKNLEKKESEELVKKQREQKYKDKNYIPKGLKLGIIGMSIMTLIYSILLIVMYFLGNETNNHYGIKIAYAICLIISSISMFITVIIHNKYCQYISIVILIIIVTLTSMLPTLGVI